MATHRATGSNRLKGFIDIPLMCVRTVAPMALWKAKLPVLRLVVIAALAMVAFAGHAGSAQARCPIDRTCVPPEGDLVANLHTEVTGPQTAVRYQSVTYTFPVGN